MTTIIQAEPGESIWRAAERVIVMATRSGMDHFLSHNHIVVRVYPGSCEYDIVEKWDLKRQLQHGTT